MRVENIIRDDNFSGFMRLYDQIVETILSDVPNDSRKTCMTAFSEPETCYLLYKTIRAKKPGTVVETGAFIGLSTIVCAAALRENHKNGGPHGQIYTISLDNFYRVDSPLTRATAACAKLGLSEYAHFIEGSSTPAAFMETTDPKIAREREDYLVNRIAAEGRDSLLNRLVATLGKVDIFYLDGLHYEAFQMTEISAAIGNLSESGCIFIDDVLLSTQAAPVRHLLRSIMKFDIDLYRIFDFVRLGLRFYRLPWIIESFRSSDIAHVTAFRSGRVFSRIIRLDPNPAYNSYYGRLATWYSPLTLDEFLAKYELRPKGSAA